MFKATLDGPLSNQVSWKLSLVMAGGLEGVEVATLLGQTFITEGIPRVSPETGRHSTTTKCSISLVMVRIIFVGQLLGITIFPLIHMFCLLADRRDKISILFFSV